MSNKFPYPGTVEHNWTVRKAIIARQANQIEVDNGSRVGWKQTLHSLPSSAFDSDHELVYIRIPNAFKPKGLVSVFF